MSMARCPIETRDDMNALQLLPGLKGWFENYTNQFFADDPATHENMTLKTAHTRRVCDLIVDIGKSLNLNPEELAVAESAALLHDIGRFEQYRRYGTFSDFKSENHARLGVTIINASGVLDTLGEPTARIILKAVEWHNRFALPEEAEECSLFLSRLLRDADKLDIWHVVTNYYKKRGDSRNRVIELGLPDEDLISDPVYTALMNCRLARIEDLRTLNDFKALQIGWVYDLNFRRSFQIARDNHYLDKIRQAISTAPERATQIHTAAKAWLAKNCA